VLGGDGRKYGVLVLQGALMDVNAFMEPLFQVLAIAAVLSIGVGVIRRLLSGAVEDDGSLDD
jgi:hypothetical protein